MVKWADGTAALIRAMNDGDLIELLDEVGDPSAAGWRTSDGPLWLEFPKIDSALPDGDISPYDLSIGRPEAAPAVSLKTNSSQRCIPTFRRSAAARRARIVR